MIRKPSPGRVLKPLRPRLCLGRKVARFASRVLGVLLLSLASFPALAPCQAEGPKISIRLIQNGAAAKEWALAVEGLPASALTKLAEVRWAANQWNQLFAVHVGNGKPAKNRAAI